MERPERLSLQSADGAQLNLDALYQIAPSCFTEATDPKTGKIKRVVNFDVLRQLLGDDTVEDATEAYEFNWVGKQEARAEVLRPINKTLRPVKEDSVDWDNTQNLYIEGDNLEVLKLLQKSYLGKVKMIYIDPPYNTGNDFVYNDKFSIGSSEWSDSSGDYDEDGNLLVNPMVKNTEANGRFHTDWLNMMYPRLRVAKDLLSKDGSIFITLDDHEYSNGKKLCDEIFGEHNFVATIIWENFYGRSNAAAISPSHNYIMLYSKMGEDWKNVRNLLERDEKSLGNYKNPDNDPKGPWRLGPIFASGERHEGLMYTIRTPKGELVSPPKGSHWRMLEQDFWKRVEEGSIVFGMDGNGSPATKLYLSEVQSGLVPRSIWLHDEAGHTQDGKRELMSLFPECSVFDTPKPTKLIRQIIKIATNNDDIVLDFFSGSATTAHAVMQLNAMNTDSKRKFVMVQLPEMFDENSEVYLNGFSNLCEVGKERIRRAGKKIKEESPLTTQDLDTGFRVLKLDSSNMQDVYYTPSEFNEQKLFDDNIKPDRLGNDGEDLLFQTMIELGIELSAKIEKRSIAGKTVWSVSDGYLMACFDEEVNETTITEIARQQPYYFVMRDSSLANDQVADNFEQIWEEYSKDTVRRII